MSVIAVISLGLLLYAVFPWLTYIYAREKRRNTKIWLVLGILLPGIATLILALLPDKSEPDTNGK